MEMEMGNFPSQGSLGLLSNGNIAVCEGDTRRLSIFDSQSNFIRHVGAGQLPKPFHLFVDSGDNILVANADTSTNQIMVFKADGSLVKNISIYGHNGAIGICMDPEGRIITPSHSGVVFVI